MNTWPTFQNVLIIFQVSHDELLERNVNAVNVSKAFTVRSMNRFRSSLLVLAESEQLSFKTYPPPPKLILQIPLAHSTASLGECDEISRLQKKQVLVLSN